MKPKTTRKTAAKAAVGKPTTKKMSDVKATTKKAVTKKTAPKAVRATSSHTLAVLKLIVQALDGKKAEDLRVLDVSQQSSITDYLVLANGNSEPHLRALRVELEKVLDAHKVRILGMDTGKGSGWIVVDAFEVMVHLFTTENRDKYRMESLWKDAKDVAISRLIN